MGGCEKWAILIGVDHYHESLGSLKYAGADCRTLRDTLVSGPLGFPEDQVLLLDDMQDAEYRPTFANIHSFLGSWLAAPKEDDLVFVYFAGHGRLVDGKTYLVPGDATLSSIHTLGIPLRQVQDVIDRSKAKRKLLILDACHSGAGRDVAVMTGDMQSAIAQGTGIYTISSCGADESSHEWDEKGHGVFSHFLAEALQGGCSPSADGRLTVDRLYEWVHDRVAKWAAQHRCAQTPQRFAKGAGTVVLAESAPDHAALAEQYRREAEEAKARLAEIELCDARERSSKEQKMPRRLGKRSSGRCEVVEWEKWFSQNRHGEWSYNLVVAYILGSLLISVLMGGLVGSTLLNLPGVVCAMISILGGPGLIGCVHYLLLQKHRNKYRLHCANQCFKVGDYIQGSSYAFAIGRAGVDPATAGAMLVSLAELAEENGDSEQARGLYQHAETFWKNPHAKRALYELEKQMRKAAGH